MPEERPDLDELLRSQKEMLARLDALVEKAPLPKSPPEEPLFATVRKLKWLRQDLDGLIAHFDALLAAWQRQQARGDVATLPELTQRLKDLEARLERLERREDA